jgi:hypothetical protein
MYPAGYKAPQTRTVSVPPYPPTGISVSASTGSNLLVAWTAPKTDSAHAAAASFNLRFSPSGVGAWTVFTGVTSPYELSELTGGTAFDVQLQSVNAAGTGVWSMTSTATAAVILPNVPEDVTVALGSGSGLTVSWTAPAVDATHGAATSFNLQSSPSGAGAWTALAGVNSPYALASLVSGVTIDVQVQSSNSAGVSPWSAIATMTTALMPPNGATGLTLAQGTGSNLAVTWTAPAADATHGAPAGYTIRWSPSGAATWTTVSSVTNPFQLSGLPSATAIDVQVQAVNAADGGVWSAIKTLMTATIVTVPNAPAGVSLANGNGSDLLVTWTAPAPDGTHSPATGYNLRSSPSGAATWTTLSGVSSPYDLSGFSGNSPIDVQVQATNSAGSGAWSAISTLTTGALAPNAPAIAAVAPPPDGTVTKLAVSWTAPATDGTHSAATGYNLRYSPTGAGTWTTVTSVTSPYTITGLAGASAYDVEVQATNAASSPSAWSAVTTGRTWGATVVEGGWVAAATQVHSTPVAPNTGVQMTAVAAPAAVTGAAFAWSTSATTVPTSGLIAAQPDSATNGWGQWFSAPSTTGTFYLWLLAQGAGSTTIGAFVTPAITVT